MKVFDTVLDVSKSNDVFDKFIRTIERLNLSDSQNAPALRELDKRIHQLDRILQDLQDNNDPQSKLIADGINTVANFWLLVIDNIDPSYEFILALVYHVQALYLLAITSLHTSDDEEVIANFGRLVSGNTIIYAFLHKQEESGLKVSITNYQHDDNIFQSIAEHMINEMHSNGVSTAFEANWAFANVFAPTGKPEVERRVRDFEWDMKVTFSSDYDPAKIGFFLWSVASALNSIDGVTTEITDWGNGSRWAKIVIKMKDILAKKEVKEILEKGRDAAVSQYLEAPVVNVNKTKAETELISAQAKQLPDGEHLSRMRELELQEKEAQVRSMHLDNLAKQFELIAKASQMVKAGLVSVDSVQIDINDALFYVKKQNVIGKGEDIMEKPGDE